MQPVPEGNQVLIKVMAAGLNRSDVMSRSSNLYGKHIPDEIPGLELSGVVEAAGPGVRRWKKGDRVCTLMAGGGYAEYAVADERLCLPVPEGMSFEQAAALPETVFTIWYNVFKLCRFQAGEHFLVHGGSSGIGVMAIQLVKAMGGRVYTTAGTAEKCRFCEQLGAVEAINYKTEDFVSRLKPAGIDVVLDMTGGDNTLKNIDIMRTGGRLSYINAMTGSKSEIDILQLMVKGLTLTGSMLKPQTDELKAALAAEIEEKVWPLIASGKIRPVIYRVFPLAEAGAAQALMESSTHIGKILLRTDAADQG